MIFKVLSNIVDSVILWRALCKCLLNTAQAPGINHLSWKPVPGFDHCMHRLWCFIHQKSGCFRRCDNTGFFPPINRRSLWWDSSEVRKGMVLYIWKLPSTESLQLSSIVQRILFICLSGCAVTAYWIQALLGSTPEIQKDWKSQDQGIPSHKASRSHSSLDKIPATASENFMWEKKVWSER